MGAKWTRCKEPHHVTFFICLILFVIALLARFNVLPLPLALAEIVSWAWVVGFGLLLLAVRIKGL